MFGIKEFEEKERQQSHSFIFFNQGPPYCELGWKSYRLFNKLVSSALLELKGDYGAEVFVYEHEIIDIEGAFLWGFSFFESEPTKREVVTKKLHEKLYVIMENIPELTGRHIINNHDNDFEIDLAWGMHYMELVMSAEVEIEPRYSPPKEKSYKKMDIDLIQFSQEITVSEFKRVIGEHTSLQSVEDLEYRYAEDGIFSNKYRENKYLREEFIPLISFLEGRNVPGDVIVQLGIQKKTYDAKLIGPDHELIIEITMGSPKNDHLLTSILNGSHPGALPLKAKAYFKKEMDSLSSRIVQAIENKHEKKYQDKRILMVVVQIEYIYQGEQYIIDEIIKEVRESMIVGRGGFKEILILFGGKLHTLFEGEKMFPFTKIDLENFISQVICHTAEKLGIEHAEFKSRAELEREISQLDQMGLELLIKFVEAYRDWYQYNYDENGIGIENLPDQNKVKALISGRDSTRDALLTHIGS